MKEVALNIVLGALVGAVYGWFLQWSFSQEGTSGLGGVMTLTFLVGAPFVAGLLSILVGERRQRHPWPIRVFLPWVPCISLFVAAIAAGFTALICFILALPVFLVVASVGGVAGGLIGDLLRRRGSSTPMLALALLPFLMGPIERQFPVHDAIRTVEVETVIEADAATIWGQITRVPPIQEHERESRLFQTLRIPRPIEATLEREGEGAIRHGIFEGGLRFVETVTAWQPGRELAFSIKADVAAIPAPHDLRLIGSRYFDVTSARYRFEPLGDGRTRLYLSSTHRLSTHFNFYGVWWTEAILRDFQAHVLSVVKRRAEALQRGA
jgi:hypothetical protein